MQYSRRALPLYLACLIGLASPDAAQVADASSPVANFGTLTLTEPLEHTFHLQNDGTEVLDITTVQLQPPLVAVRATSRIAPGETGRLTVRLGQPRRKGPFDGEIVVRFKQASAGTRSFRLRGSLVPPIELQPSYGFYVVAQRGEVVERSLEVVNHEQTPLDIVGIEYDGSRFTPTIDTLEAGRRYRVTVRTKADAPAGRGSESVRLVSSNAKYGTLPIQAHVWIKERVYAFPDSLDFGVIDTARQAGDTIEQSIMVYQVGGKDFRVAAETNAGFLSLSVSGSGSGDRYKVTAFINPDKLPAGLIDRSVVVTTNDPEFPTIVIPVRGVATRSR